MIWLTAGGIVALDQLSKFLFLYFSPYYTSINSGALAFSNVQATIITIIFLLLLLGLFLRDKKHLTKYFIASLGFALALGGSISNLIDRISRSGVLDLGNKTIGTNLADICIFVGLFLLFYFYLSKRTVERQG